MAKAKKEAAPKEAPVADKAAAVEEKVVHTTVTVASQCAEGSETVVKIETPNADNQETVVKNGQSQTFEVDCNQKLVVSERDAPSSTTYAGKAQ